MTKKSYIVVGVTAESSDYYHGESEFWNVRVFTNKEKAITFAEQCQSIAAALYKRDIVGDVIPECDPCFWNMNQGRSSPPTYQVEEIPMDCEG